MNSELLKQILGGICALVVFIVISINGAYMLFSPRAWFRLPSWIRLNGTLSESKYGSGWGSIKIRLFGAFTLVFIASLLYHMFSTRHHY
jgi:hypothetical protein